MACREGRIPSGVRTREDASQKRFERKRGGNCGNESRPTSKEQTEAHDFKKDVLNVSREGRMGAAGLRDAVERSFPPRFYRERRETYLHYRFLRKRAPSRTIGRGMRDGERMVCERTGWTRQRAMGDSIWEWLGVTSPLFTIGKFNECTPTQGKLPISIHHPQAAV
jgi:hypothetical protein